MNADRIIVLNNGVVDGFGSHEELMETNAIYREVYDDYIIPLTNKASPDFTELAHAIGFSMHVVCLSLCTAVQNYGICHREHSGTETIYSSIWKDSRSLL